MSIHSKLSASKIQPMGLCGRLEAISAPTRGKARKDTKLSVSLTVPTVPQLLVDCAEGARKYNMTFATNMVTESAASDQASQAVRVLIPPTPRPCSLVRSVTAPLYNTTVSNRYDKRYEEKFLRDIRPHQRHTRTWWHRGWGGEGYKSAHQMQYGW